MKPSRPNRVVWAAFYWARPDWFFETVRSFASPIRTGNTPGAPSHRRAGHTNRSCVRS